MGSWKRTSYYSLDFECLPKAHVLNVWTIVHGAIRRWWNFKEVEPSGASNHWDDLLKGTMELQTLPLFFFFFYFPATREAVFLCHAHPATGPKAIGIINMFRNPQNHKPK